MTHKTNFWQLWICFMYMSMVWPKLNLQRLSATFVRRKPTALPVNKQSVQDIPGQHHLPQKSSRKICRANPMRTKLIRAVWFGVDQCCQWKRGDGIHWYPGAYRLISCDEKHVSVVVQLINLALFSMLCNKLARLHQPIYFQVEQRKIANRNRLRYEAVYLQILNF